MAGSLAARDSPADAIESPGGNSSVSSDVPARSLRIAKSLTVTFMIISGLARTTRMPKDLVQIKDSEIGDEAYKTAALITPEV